jgi:hypothetical protein
MLTLIQSIKRYRLWAISLVFVFVAIKACELFPESTFTLANDSRLPKWVKLPPGVTRGDTSLTLNFYSIPWTGNARFTLMDKNQRKLEKYTGRTICKRPFQATSPPQGGPPGYPNYEAVTVNGITEIMEQRKPEPFLYVTDEPSVWKQYESLGC